ncbi:MAG: glycogen/starch/alpha-glucan phosphorylase, partial [Methylobacteriaceae bacterium]|nr:glycogen/starch/alpha-glucan phosphorylase [Methylobacteriaceae bacterium]
FGLTAEEVEERRSKGIDATETIASSPILREVLDVLSMGVFSPDDRDRYHQIVDLLTHHDYFLVTADFDAYYKAQRDVAARWRDRPAWWRSSLLNTARVGWFSSDRAIGEYAGQIWDVPVRASRQDSHAG